MKQILNLFIFFLFLSCADEFIAENPIDPDNPDYIPPIVSFVTGPNPGETIYAENTVITFSGNESSMLYRSQLDSSGWSGWISSQSITLDYLDEGDHIFYLQGQYTTGDTSYAISVPFSVDAVSGPAIMFFPRKTIANQGETVQLKIIAEEVYSLAGLEANIEYDPGKLTILEVASGEIFTETGDPIFFFEDKKEIGLLTLTSAVWGNTEPAFTGTQVIATLDIRVEQVGNLAINFSGNEVFRDQDNIEIQISESVPGLVIVN